ncbi:alanine racemase [Actinoplanes sp. NPDC089786]|uniref:alanine racemase n=1 Tax=Actinoplanes sp. NPDC089786 TaxID=3155185 RepID=UPI00341B1C23
MLDIPDEPIDWRAKGFWSPSGGGPARGSSIFDGGFTWPLLTIRESAVRANIATMAAYAARHGLDFAPHAKTTMAPRLLDLQLEAGAWGLTVATPNQALVLRRLGVPRVLIANEVLEPAALRWLATEVAAGWAVWFQVDSVAGVTAAAEAASAAGGHLRVLVELGHAGGRTGVRDLGEMEAVARAVSASPALSLSGVTGYEGQLSDEPSVDAFLDQLAAGVRRLGEAGLLPPTPMVSAGGSAWFDRVTARLAGAGLGQLILRSGASVTHDDGFYREKTPFNRVPAEGPLTAAMEMWAQIISVPEPGLALAGLGKRDAPFDEGLPIVLEPATGLTVTKLNDHHCYLRVAPDMPVRPGDLIRFGLSHPCTAFDKWRDIPLVDDERRLVDVLHTYL